MTPSWFPNSIDLFTSKARFALWQWPTSLGENTRAAQSNSAWFSPLGWIFKVNLVGDQSGTAPGLSAGLRGTV